MLHVPSLRSDGSNRRHWRTLWHFTAVFAFLLHFSRFRIAKRPGIRIVVDLELSDLNNATNNNGAINYWFSFICTLTLLFWYAVTPMKAVSGNVKLLLMCLYSSDSQTIFTVGWYFCMELRITYNKLLTASALKLVLIKTLHRQAILDTFVSSKHNVNINFNAKT